MNRRQGTVTVKVYPMGLRSGTARVSAAILVIWDAVRPYLCNQAATIHGVFLAKRGTSATRAAVTVALALKHALPLLHVCWRPAVSK